MGGLKAEVPSGEERARIDTTSPDFEPHKPRVRKFGTGYMTMTDDRIYEEKYSEKRLWGKL